MNDERAGDSEEQFPEPLVGAEVELRDFDYFPLEINRLRRSKAWLLAKRRPELGFYMVNLWMAAWHESPAGSLEDDDDVLADAAMCPPAKWPRIRDDVMRGWVKCSDGRLYHPVVVERVVKAWDAKVDRRAQTKAATEARARRRAERDEQRNVERDDERSDARQNDATFTKGSEGKRSEDKNTLSSGTNVPSERVSARAKRKFKISEWKGPDPDALAWLADRGIGHMHPAETEKFRAYYAARDERLADWTEAWRLWVMRAGEFGSARAGPGDAEKPAAERDADLWRLRLKGYRPGRFWPGTWGPRPEEPGCWVPAEILRECGVGVAA